MPTVVHNVQTLAAVPWIVRNGAEAFAETGAADSPGTILVQLRTPGGEGIAEVPFGTPLRDIVALGGKLPTGRSSKAILVGGPSGGLLPTCSTRRIPSTRYGPPVRTSAPVPWSSPTIGPASWTWPAR